MKRFKNIVFVSNGDESDIMALKQAVELAKSNQAKLVIVGYFYQLKTLKQDQSRFKSLIQEMLERKFLQLYQYVDQYIQGIETEVKVFYDKPFIDIIKEVIEFDRDLLIKAIEEPEKLSNVIFSSLDLKLLRKCPCPVWLIKPYEQKGDKQIIVALDYQPDNPENNTLNTQMLNMAVSLALSEFYELHVVHAWKLDHEIFLRSVRIQNSKKVVDEMVEEEQEKRNKWLAKEIEISINSLGKTTSHYLDPQLHVIKGEAKNVIPELVKSLEAELIIMGTVGRSGISGYFIGNTAETILSKIDCSVLAIKPKDFVSPVKLN